MKRGPSARPAVAKAWEKSAALRKGRLEEVLLRIDAGTDQTSVTAGNFSLQIRDAAFVQELDRDGKAQLRLKAVFDGSTLGDDPVTVTLLRADFCLAKDRMTLLVVGSKGEAFARKFDPMVPRMFDYVSLVPPRWPPGSRGVVVFEIEVAGKKHLLRSKIAAIEKKE